jgi:hypothetical protein
MASNLFGTKKRRDGGGDAVARGLCPSSRFAGALARRRVRIARHGAHAVHADADFCIVGTVMPGELKPEGPFGDLVRARRRPVRAERRLPPPTKEEPDRPAFFGRYLFACDLPGLIHSYYQQLPRAATG